MLPQTLKIAIRILFNQTPKLGYIDIGDLGFTQGSLQPHGHMALTVPRPNLHVKCPFSLQSLGRMLKVTSCAAMTK